jgi:hypothetical protein
MSRNSSKHWRQQYSENVVPSAFDRFHNELCMSDLSDDHSIVAEDGEGTLAEHNLATLYG